MSIEVGVVALPIGNIEDLSRRAAAWLTRADRIFCEDTRKTKELLARAGITFRAKLVALPGDREHEFDWGRLADEVRAGNESWVLVSDAGTPVVNDPGVGLLKFCREQGIAVVALPGPCAPVLAWQWSGGFGLPFVFMGFVPKAKRAGAKELAQFFAPLSVAATFAFFDTKHQFETTLEHLIEAGAGARRMFVAREMTKTHEELVSGTVVECLASLRATMAATGGALGELTLLIEGLSGGANERPALKIEELAHIRNSPPKEAAKIAAQLTGLSTRDCYNALLKDSGET